MDIELSEACPERSRRVRGQRSNARSQRSGSVFCSLFSVLCFLFSVFCLLYFASGCEETGSQKPALAEQVRLLEQEKAQLAHQVEQSNAENEQLKKQIQVLSDLRPQVKPEDIYDLQRIKITRYTNFYDKDKDGQKEKLIVYIQPIDTNGDIIKAAGTMDVQLWDLNKTGGEAMLGQWHITANELRKLWFATLITINYRLTFDITGIVDKFDEPLTVKVTFTDYLSGKVFEEQRVIKPQKN